MKKVKIGLVVLLVILFAMPVFAQGQADKKADQINMGIMFALTGAGSAQGVKQLDAALLAVEEINARGGVNLNGTKLKINPIVQDTETKPDAAVRKLKAMVEVDGVTAILGGTFANVAQAMSDQTKRTPAMFCAVNGVAEEFFMKENKGPYSFSTMADVTSMGRGGATYVTEMLKKNNIVVLLPDYAYGQGAGRGIKEVFDEKGTKYTIIWTPVGAADLTPYLIKAKELKPEMIMMGQWGADAINILKQAYDMRLHNDTELFFNWIVDVFATGISPEALSNVTVQMYWYHDMSSFDDPEVTRLSKEFNDRYVAKYNEPCDPYAMSGYLAVNEIVRSMELAGSTDPAKMYEALMANPDTMTPKGPATLGIDGRYTYKYGSFIGDGLGAAERKDVKFDYVNIIDSFEGARFMKPASELGW